jgi:hypothetical protein
VESNIKKRVKADDKLKKERRQDRKEGKEGMKK